MAAAAISDETFAAPEPVYPLGPDALYRSTPPAGSQAADQSATTQ